MIIKSLKNTSFKEIANCFIKAFEHYFVEMPKDHNYYKNRWTNAKVNYEYSYGIFDENNLVGFILTVVDYRKEQLTAYNAGTGVLPLYRGKKLVKKLYEFALIQFKNNNINKCTLEVITANKFAIKAYESVGFKIQRELICFSGTIKVKNEHFTLNEHSFKSINWNNLPNQDMYAWDFQKESIKHLNLRYFELLENNKLIAYFIINLDNKYLMQFNLLNKNKNWNQLFSAIKSISKEIKIINVAKNRTEKIKIITSVGLKKTVTQYEMDLIH